MGMLDVSSDELKRSWKRQEQQAKGIPDAAARRMLLFYAVECGGKHQLMLREGNFMYSRMPDKYKDFLHDIQKILRELGLEEKCDFPIVQSEHGEGITPGHYQEMWRYGINCKNANEMGRLIEDSMQKALQLLHEQEGRKWNRL